MTDLAKMGTKKKRVFSGFQPSGELHLGNYLGAFKGWAERQSQKENFFCIVDLHAITVPQAPDDLRARTRSHAAMLFALGLDPAHCAIFVQSHVEAHAEACWILNCVTPLGWLERMTQYKDKAGSQESVLTGLLAYPVLMAADIILYDANEVPVGDDQKQHVELARDIAQRFNHQYGETFIVPEPVTQGRIMSLNDPKVKMSKTYSSVRGHAVGMLDDAKEVERSIKRAMTDSGGDIVFSDEPTKAGVNNLLRIYQSIVGKSDEDVEKDFANARGYGDLKTRVSEVVIEELRPIRERYYEIVEDQNELDRLLANGAAQARSVSQPKLDEVKHRVGLVLPGNR